MFPELPGDSMKPNTGELWMCSELMNVWVRNDRRTLRITGPGLVVDVHRNHDMHGDYYRVLWGNEMKDFMENNFLERIG